MLTGSVRCVRHDLMMARLVTFPLANDGSALKRTGLASRSRNALRHAMEDESIDGLQRVILNERARLLRFLAARGAGDDAEDVLHDLWQRVAGASGPPVAEPIAYLFRAAENLMRDRRRSAVSRGRRQMEWHETSTTLEEEPVGERMLIARERVKQAEAVLVGLGARADRVFRLYRLEGKGQAEIARDLGVSLSSVEKDLQKAYRALAELKGQFDAE